MIYLFRYFGATLVYDEAPALFWSHKIGWQPVEDGGVLDDLRIYFDGNKENSNLFIPVSDLENLLDAISHLKGSASSSGSDGIP